MIKLSLTYKYKVVIFFMIMDISNFTKIEEEEELQINQKYFYNNLEVLNLRAFTMLYTMSCSIVSYPS
jgi:hypothetical protein